MNPTQKNLIIVLAILVVIFAGSSYYFFAKYQTLRENPNAITQEEIDTLLAEVGELILLPQDEVPTIATVADPEALKDQAFFANAQKDDRVLIYAGAQKAILYSPARKQVIEVAPVNIGEGELPPAVAPAAPEIETTPEVTQ